MTAVNRRLAAAIAEQGIPLTADLVAAGPERRYPISPRPAEDPRFTLGLALDVAKVLHEHGYPNVTSGRDFLELQQALFGFLYVGPDEGDAS
jgi:hypothetical protein